MHLAPGDVKTISDKGRFSSDLDTLKIQYWTSRNASISRRKFSMNKAGINDLTPTLTEAYSGVKTEQLHNDAKTFASGLFDGVMFFKILVVANYLN